MILSTQVYLHDSIPVPFTPVGHHTRPNFVGQQFHQVPVIHHTSLITWWEIAGYTPVN